MTHQTTDTEWTGHNMQRITVTLEMHPDDYRRMREAAQTAQIPEPEFCALAIHKGVVVLFVHFLTVSPQSLC
ncbi:hypothetical protein ACUW9Q_004725 [Ralstonia pickettii]|uniref:hypothetical protein n=1 Tax=Ralstonia pickettii TaxID=329 RepID=UPI0015FCDCCD|nr:hypothetical protein [Ralstonia pickettii]MBX3808282.1 hypothetical protein [Ralstonia pickettii]